MIKANYQHWGIEQLETELRRLRRERWMADLDRETYNEFSERITRITEAIHYKGRTG